MEDIGVTMETESITSKILQALKREKEKIR